MTAPIALGSRRELFVDHFLIEHLNEAALHLNPPIRREVVYSSLPAPGTTPVRVATISPRTGIAFFYITEAFTRLVRTTPTARLARLPT